MDGDLGTKGQGQLARREAATFFLGTVAAKRRKYQGTIATERRKIKGQSPRSGKQHQGAITARNEFLVAITVPKQKYGIQGRKLRSEFIGERERRSFTIVPQLRCIVSCPSAWL